MNVRALALSLFIIVKCILSVASIQGQEGTTQIAQRSAEVWLALVDSGDYSASWETAATLFKNAITSEKWEAALQAARTPLGRLRSRALKSTTSTKTLPGVPDGEYFVFQFNASFERKQSALETVTAVRETDGTWHVGGYFIK